MSGYVASSIGSMSLFSKSSQNRNVTFSSKTVMVNENVEIENQDEKVLSNSVMAGIMFAVMMSFFNIGSSTSASHSNVSSVNPYAVPVINRNNYEELDEERESEALESDRIQSLLGMNTTHWARILKVERKTIYNWRKFPDTRMKANAEKRLNVLNEFSKEFNPSHAKYFSKFIFGRKSDLNLSKSFLSENLIVEDLIEQYDNVYTKLDGLVKRSKLLGS